MMRGETAELIGSLRHFEHDAIKSEDLPHFGKSFA